MLLNTRNLTVYFHIATVAVEKDFAWQHFIQERYKRKI